MAKKKRKVVNKLKRRAYAIKKKVKYALRSASGIKGIKLTTGKSKYKEGWHTTWDGKKVYLRSGLELKYAKSLDKKKVIYEVETKSFFYYDTQLKARKRAFPDFYIPSENKIVEIKGSHILDVQNLNDRKRVIEGEGYIFEIIVDGKKFEL